MTNEEKLDFIKANYKSARCWELLQGEEKLIFYEEWIKTLMNIIPTNLYKYRSCNEDNLKMLQNKTAWFSCPSTWNDPIDVTVSYDLDKDADELEKNFAETYERLADDLFGNKVANPGIPKQVQDFIEKVNN